MNFKNFVNYIKNIVKKKEESLESLLIEIDKKDQKINFDKYNTRIINAVSKEIIKTNLNAEVKKDILSPNATSIKKNNKSIKNNIILTYANMAIVSLFCLSASFSPESYLNLYYKAYHYNKDLFYFIYYGMNTITSILLILLILLPLLLLKQIIKRKTIINKIKNDFNILDINKNLEDKTLEAIQNIKNPELDDIKADLCKYITQKNNNTLNKILNNNKINCIKKEINTNLFEQHDLNISEKIIK